MHTVALCQGLSMDLQHTEFTIIVLFIIVCKTAVTYHGINIHEITNLSLLLNFGIEFIGLNNYVYNQNWLYQIVVGLIKIYQTYRLATIF